MIVSIRTSLLYIMQNYWQEKQNPYKKNDFANWIRQDCVKPFHNVLRHYGERYLIQGSCGKGRWADCPWIGIFDSLKTTSAQYGYYLVYLFDSGMKGVYLSLNQGVTVVREEYKRSAEIVLAVRAEDYRCKLDFEPGDKMYLKLNSTLPNPRLYEKGNILSTYYSAEDLPEEHVLCEDLNRFLQYYQALVDVDSDNSVGETLLPNEIIERKLKRLHEKFDRRGDIALKVKQKKGYVCEACGLKLEDMYGELGKAYIEAHHLLPFSQLHEGATQLNLDTDFAVLCSNCHRMIHRLSDPSQLEELRAIIAKQMHK